MVKPTRLEQTQRMIAWVGVAPCVLGSLCCSCPDTCDAVFNRPDSSRCQLRLTTGVLLALSSSLQGLQLIFACGTATPKLGPKCGTVTTTDTHLGSV